MTEQPRPRISDQINRVFARPLIVFQENIENSKPIDEDEVVIPQTLHRKNVRSFTEEGQMLLDQHPHIYNHNIAGKDFFIVHDDIDLAAPIGDYGDDFAQRLISATYTLRKAALNEQNATNIIPETEILREERLAAYQAVNPSIDETDIGSFDPFTQGIQSVLFVAGLFTAEKIEGFEDPFQLLDELTKQKIFSKFSLIVPSTITARMGNRGWTFTPPALDQTENKLSVSSILVNHFTGEDREKYKDLSTTASRLLDRRGCPAARILPGFILYPII